MALYRRAGSTRLVVVSLVMVSLLTITVDFRDGNSGPLAEIGKATLTVIGPMQGAISRVFHPVGAFFSGLFRVGSLQSENYRLKNEVRSLQNQLATNISNERQFKEVLALLKIQQALSLHTVTGAHVISAGVSNFEWSVTIDKGSAEGVKPTDFAVTGDGLVGHLQEVGLHDSRIQLIIDPRSGVAARLSASGQTGLVSGQRNQDLLMDLVPPDATVAANELVVTAGYASGLYPPNINIGFVSQVYSDSSSLAKIIRVRPAVDFSSLEFVLVVRKT
jgi:rod shape-determining protein MreC